MRRHRPLTLYIEGLDSVQVMSAAARRELHLAWLPFFMTIRLIRVSMSITRV
jgi:hypothetical protein